MNIGKADMYTIKVVRFDEYQQLEPIEQKLMDMEDAFHAGEAQNSKPFKYVESDNSNKFNDVRDMFVDDEGIMLIAMRGTEPAGFAIISGARYEDTVYIVSVFVDDKHRGRGLGKLLMDACFENAHSVRRDVKHLLLNVLASNTGAIRLYESYGMKVFSQQMAVKI